MDEQRISQYSGTSETPQITDAFYARHREAPNVSGVTGGSGRISPPLRKIEFSGLYPTRITAKVIRRFSVSVCTVSTAGYSRCQIAERHVRSAHPIRIGFRYPTAGHGLGLHAGERVRRLFRVRNKRYRHL